MELRLTFKFDLVNRCMWRCAQDVSMGERNELEGECGTCGVATWR